MGQWWPNPTVRCCKGFFVQKFIFQRMIRTEFEIHRGQFSVAEVI